jgi:membrane fusion protein, heavy metal efflux system
MTTMATPPRPDRPPASPERPPWRARLWTQIQLVTAIGLTLAVLAWLRWGDPFHALHPAPTAGETASETAPVQLTASGLITIKPDTPLHKRLEIAPVAVETLTVPFLTVTGAAVASLRPGNGPVEDRWQFASPELLGTYADWRKARADITFAEKQLGLVRELDTKRVAAQEKVVDRLRKLVAAGTDSPKDLAAEETNLMQFRIQGQKEIHEAETAMRTAQRTQAALARQLLQAGVDPDLLSQPTTRGVDIVMADVPEGQIGLARVGQGCQARFYGLPGQVFAGKVASLSPVLSRERRTLRVLFTLEDPRDVLRPGMFADVGLGTDPRRALLVPAAAVLHVGRTDYVLARAGTDAWKPVPVEVGQQYGQRVEVLKGLDERDTVIGPGAILLKPFVERAQQPSRDRPAVTNPTPATDARRTGA